MYAKVKLPDGFIKGDCENFPLCSYNPAIDDTYDDDGYCNDDGFQDWNGCLIKEWTEDNSYDEVDGTKDHPQDDCPMEIVKWMIIDIIYRWLWMQVMILETL